MAGTTAAELQIIISAEVAKAQEALRSISEGAQQMSQSLNEAGSGASESLSKVQGAATEADTALSGVAEGAQKAASTLQESLGAATEPLQQVATAADEAKTSLDALGQGAAEPIQQLETVAAELTGELQKTAAAAAEATTGLKDAGAAAEKSAGEMLSLGTAAEETKKGIEGTKAAMAGFMVIMGAGMLGEFADSAEKQALALGQLQSMTGQSSQQVEQLSVVAAAAGVSMGDLTTTVGRMDMRMGRAMSGSASFSKTLSALGVSAQAFTNANSSQQAQMLASALDQAHLPAKQLASTLKTLGVNTATFVNAASSSQLSQLASGLAQVQNSGQSVGRMLQDAGINASKFMQLPFSQQLNQVADAFNNTKNRAQATALVMTVFGRRGASMIPLLQHMKEMNDYAAQFHLPKMNFEEMQTAAMKTKMLVSIMQIWMTDVVTKVLPIVDSVAKAFFDLASNLTHPIAAVKKMTQDIGPLGTSIILLVSAFQAAKVAISLYETVTKTAGVAMAIWNGITKAAAIAQLAFNAVMDANPIALIVIAIAGLIAVIALLVTHWKQVTDWIQVNWGVNIPQILNQLGKVFNTVWNAIQSVVVSVWNFVGKYIMSGVNTVWSYWKSIWPEVKQIFEVVWTAMKVLLLPTLTVMYISIKTALGIIQAIWKNVWGMIVDVFKLVWDDITGMVKLSWDIISGIFKIALDLLTGHWGKAWNDMKTTLGNVWGDIKGLFTNMLHDALDFGKNLVMMIANGIEGAIGSVISAVKNVAGAIKGFLGFHSPTEQGPGADADMWAPNFIQMYTQGLQSGLPKVQAALAQILSPTGVLGSIGVTGSATHSITHSWPSGALPSGVSGGGSPTIINVSGNVTRSEEELANRIASVFQQKLKMRTQLG